MRAAHPDHARCTIICLSDAGPLAPEARSTGARVISLELRRSSSNPAVRVWRLICGCARLAVVLRQLRPDVIYAFLGLSYLVAFPIRRTREFARDKAPPVFLDTDLRENPMSRRWGKWFGRATWYRQKDRHGRREPGRATGVRADGAAAGAGSLAPGQRWSASRKRDVVLRLLRGESLEALSREAGVEIYRLDAWRERAMAGLELGLKARHGEPVAEMLDAAKRHIGELSMEIELLRERARAAEQRLLLAMRRSRR